MAITREWLESVLRGAYAAQQAPVPRNFENALDFWMDGVSEFDRDRVYRVISRLVCSGTSIKSLKISTVVRLAKQSPKNICDVIETVCAESGYHPAQIVGKSREQGLTRARQVAMVLAREATGVSPARVGKAFGGRDRTTTLHAINRVHELIETDADVSSLVSKCRASLELH